MTSKILLSPGFESLCCGGSQQVEHHEQYKGGGTFSYNAMSSKIRTKDCYLHLLDKKNHIKKPCNTTKVKLPRKANLEDDIMNDVLRNQHFNSNIKGGSDSISAKSHNSIRAGGRRSLIGKQC